MLKKIYNKNFSLLYIIIIYSGYQSCINNENVDDVVFRSNIKEKGLISYNTTKNKIFVMDSMSNKTNMILNDYDWDLCYPPIVIDKNKILYQKNINKEKFLVKFNFKDNKELWSYKINGNLKCHSHINDSVVLLGLDTNLYLSLNYNVDKLDRVFDFSRNVESYFSSDLIESNDNNLYIPSPLLGKKSLLKININDKVIVWEYPINYNFFNYTITKKGVFFISTDDFTKGEIGLLDSNIGKVIFKQSDSPNVLVKPLLVGNNVFYADTKGNIMKFNLISLKNKIIYKSIKKDSFLGIGSSLLFLFENNIYFMDNFKIFKINTKKDEVVFVQDYNRVGFNFIVRDSLNNLKIY